MLIIKMEMVSRLPTADRKENNVIAIRQLAEWQSPSVSKRKYIVNLGKLTYPRGSLRLRQVADPRDDRNMIEYW